MRSKRSIVNILTNWLGQLLIMAVTLVSRKIFLKVLGSEYLGLNSLYANILGFLIMADIGFGNAINYSLYKPIAENDVSTIKSLMNLYKKIYCAVGTVILLLGIIITPGITSLTSDIAIEVNVRLAFIIFVFNTGVSYFFSYYSALIIADQRKYVFNIVHYIIQFIMYIGQIVVLVKTHDYYAYLIIQLCATVTENFVMRHIVRYQYPYLKKKGKFPVSKENLKSIKENIKGLVLNKVGAPLINSTDNILLSQVANISFVGVYGNYSTIISAIGNVFGQAIASTTASVGNQLVTETKENCRNIFKSIVLAGSWLYGWGAICLICLLSNFISLWYGDYMLPLGIILVLCVNVYLAGQRAVLIAYIDAGGLYSHIKYKTVVEGIVNLIVSIALGKLCGVIGIFLGTMISAGICGWGIEIHVVLKKMLDLDVKEYILVQLKYCIVLIVSGILTIYVCNRIQAESVLVLIIKMCICAVLPNIIMLMCNYNTKEYKILEVKVKGAIKRT